MSLFPKLTCLSFRIDLKLNDEALLVPFLERFNIIKYFCVFEQSVVLKEHFQCIIWMTSCNDNTRNNMRNYWRTYFRDLGEHVPNHHPISIKKSKHPQHLASYCKKTCKSQPFIITNLSIEQIATIPAWLNKRDFKKRDRGRHLDEIYAHLASLNDLTLDTFIPYYSEAYLSHFGNLPSNKLQYYRIAVRLELIDHYQYSVLLGVHFNKIRPPREINTTIKRQFNKSKRWSPNTCNKKILQLELDYPQLLNPKFN